MLAIQAVAGSCRNGECTGLEMVHGHAARDRNGPFVLIRWAARCTGRTCYNYAAPPRAGESESLKAIAERGTGDAKDRVQVVVAPSRRMLVSRIRADSLRE